MKNRKRIITTLIGMTLTAQLSPVAYTVVNAQEPTTAPQVQGEQKEGLAENVISLHGIGCEEKADQNGKPADHEVQISFDTRNYKFNVNIISGTYGEQHPFHPYHAGEYIRMALIDKDGKVKNDFSLSGNENIRKLKDELSKWTFKYGDRLRIYHAEAGGRTTITGNVSREESDISSTVNKGISKADLDKYDFEITQNGLNEVNKDIVEVNDSAKFLEALNNLKDSDNNNDKRIIKLNESITFTDKDRKAFTQAKNNPNKMELVIPECVTIIGDPNKNIEINFDGNGSLTLKGNSTRLEFVTIKDCDNTGIQVYDAKNSYLKKVTVENSQGYGIFFNGSDVKLESCTTKNNRDGGILVSSSIELTNRKGNISKVSVVDKLDQEEKDKPDIIVKNLQLDDLDINQNNTFKRAQGNSFVNLKRQKYKLMDCKYEEKKLSPYYTKLLGLDEDTELTETILSYKLVQE